MKLLGLRLCEHDSSISYYDGETVRYFKSERVYQEKHHSYDNPWGWKTDIKRIWNVDADEIDDIAIVHIPYKGMPKVDFFPSIQFKDFPSKCNVDWLNHHYAHALSHWMCTDKEPDFCFVFDGCGDPDVSWTVIKNDTVLETGSIVKSGSIGWGMEHASISVGCQANKIQDIAGKGMGLQSYGKIDYNFLKKLQKYSVYENKWIFKKQLWEEYLKDDRLLIDNLALDWFATAHYRMGEALIEYFKKFASSSDIIYYSGGVAQNVIWNTMLKNEFPNLLILPHCGDDGLSLGCVEYLRRKHNLPKLPIQRFPYSQNDCGPLNSPSHETILKTAQFLAEGKIVAWYQGNGEIGARALGNRSILMDPRIENGKYLINQIKKREYYRPFGASVLDEYKTDDFDMSYENPYMLYVAKVKNEKYPAITHIDNTCRIQTVSQNSNTTLRQLLQQFHKLTNCPVLLNTSLNAAGKPIASWPENAEEEFNTSSIDVLVIGDKITLKT